MESFTPKSAVVQLADHLRGQILSGDIGETMPGINQLVRELGMGRTRCWRRLPPWKKKACWKTGEDGGAAGF